jgi:hypothetical protein
MNEFPNALSPYREVDHKIEVVLSSTLPSKAPYNLNQN